MPGDVFDGEVGHESGAQIRQGFVLRHFKPITFQAFKFDADRIVVAVLTAKVA